MKQTALFCDPCHAQGDDVRAVDSVTIRTLEGRSDVDLCKVHKDKFKKALTGISLRANGHTSTRKKPSPRGDMVARAEKILEIIRGGPAEGMILKDIAAKFGEPWQSTARAFRNAQRLGMPVERRGWNIHARYFAGKAKKERAA